MSPPAPNENATPRLALNRREALIGATIGGLIAAVGSSPIQARATKPDAGLGERLRAALLDPTLASVLYRRGRTFKFNDDGAAPQNSPALTYIELQGLGIELIRQGITASDRQSAEIGWRAFDWGLQQQQPDGGFGVKPDYHSTTIFLGQLGAALLIDPSSATQSRLDGLERGIDWTTNLTNGAMGVARNLRFAHRFWLIASMFDAAGALLGRSDLVNRGALFAIDAARLQMPDGTNPERAGFDVGYQMAGVTFACRYFMTSELPMGRDAVMRMLPKALDREALEVGPDGNLSAEGSTRTGKEIGFAKRPKKVSRTIVAEAFFLGWRVTGDAKYEQLFRRVAGI